MRRTSRSSRDCSSRSSSSDSTSSATAYATRSIRGGKNKLLGKTALELLKRAVVGLRREALVDHLVRARDVAGAKRRVGQPHLQGSVWAAFIDRAIEPADGERWLAEPYRVIRNLRRHRSERLLVADERRVFQ